MTKYGDVGGVTRVIHGGDDRHILGHESFEILVGKDHIDCTYPFDTLRWKYAV